MKPGPAALFPERLTLRLPRGWCGRLDAAADRRRTTRSEMLRRLIESALERERACERVQAATQDRRERP